jgi:VWFA-related protein
MRRLFAAVLFFAAASANAQWLTFDDALVKARAEGKPLIVYLSGACRSCNRGPDAFLDAAEKHEAIGRLYAPFVRARASVDSKAGSVLRQLLAEKAPIPSILVLEPGGTLVAVWKYWDDLDIYANFLRLLRDEVPVMRQASARHDGGDQGEADLMIADVATHLLMYDRSKVLYRRALDDFHRRGNREREQFARIGLDFAEFLSGNRMTVVNELQRTILAAQSPKNKATGYLVLGSMEVLEGNRHGAVSAFRAALQAAEPDTQESKAARWQLEALGDLKPESNRDQASLHIIAPPRSTITGRAQFSASAALDVTRVAWFVDGVAVASADTPPFNARLNLGDTPRLHTIWAIGYGATGGAVAQAVATVNDRIDFRVALVSPVAANVSGKTAVEASVETPPDHTVKNVELFWDEERIGAFAAPPYRTTFTVPNAFGYFRAVATLDDGRTAEETRVVNAPAIGEELDVHTIAFAATVVDRNGKRIDGLTARDFIATDDGTPLALNVRDSQDEPVTIGLAIDSSGSMRFTFLQAIETAWAFLDVAVSDRDRVFLEAFDDHPHLMHSPTTDREALRNAVLDVRAGGNTAVIDAIAFGLQQFTGLAGKKALVVITDAREGTSNQSSGSAAKMAKESGLPLYVVVPRGGNVSPFSNPLVGIANASGGLMINAPKPEELPTVFGRIRDEVRGQYLLSFQSHAPTAGAWRNLRIEVTRPGAVVRTIAGYYAR